MIQRSSTLNVPGRPSVGVQPSTLAYITKNEYTFHSGIKKRRRTSSIV